MALMISVSMTNLAYLSALLRSILLPKKHLKIRLIDRFSTLEKISDDEISLSRFGDGELAIAINGKNIYFQKATVDLIEQLQYVLYKEDDCHLICLNNHFMYERYIEVIRAYERSNKNYCCYKSVQHIDDVGILKRSKQNIMYKTWFNIISRKTNRTIFGEATVFFLGHYTDKYTRMEMDAVKDKFLKIFREKKILFVGPASPLFGPSFRYISQKSRWLEMKSYEFIDIPSMNCFQYYREIKEKILSSSVPDIVMIQAGPTGSVIAHDLSVNHSLRAIDVGSLNNSILHLRTL